MVRELVHLTGMNFYVEMWGQQTLPEFSILGGEGRQKLVDRDSMLKIPPRHKEFKPILLALSCLPLHNLQVTCQSSSTSCIHKQ
jgi:hypothetical protein